MEEQEQTTTTLKSLEKQMKENCKHMTAEIERLDREIAVLKQALTKRRR